jgi:hypothetical protein
MRIDARAKKEAAPTGRLQTENRSEESLPARTITS